MTDLPVSVTVSNAGGARSAASTVVTVSSAAAGWTVFAPSSDTKTYYVSNSAGSDANNGLSQNAPLKTLAKGLSVLRNGFPDWLLLKKGDVWTGQAFTFGSQNGRSASEPMLISSYGSGARPLIKVAPAQNNAVEAIATGRADYMAMVGLEFYAYTRDPASPNFSIVDSTSAGPTGLFYLGSFHWLLLEDCKWSFFADNLVIEPQAAAGQNLTIRRCVVTDAYRTSSKGHSQGLYLENTTGTLIEENYFDRNGWCQALMGGNASLGGTVFNRNFYLSEIGNAVVFRRNISTYSSSEGLQQKPGGTIWDNTFVMNSNGFNLGGGDAPQLLMLSMAKNNVILNATDIGGQGTSQPRGSGINVISAKGANVKVTNNIVAHGSAAGSKPNETAIELESTVSNIAVTNNIVFQYHAYLSNLGSGNVVTTNAVDLSGANAAGYPDPSRTPASYNASLGGAATLAAFLVKCRAQSKDIWDDRYTANAFNNYVRSGFGVAAVPATP